MDKNVVLTFILAGLITGALISFQVKSSVPISSQFPAEELEAQRELVKSFSDEQTLLKAQIVSLRQRIEENQQKNEAITKSSNLQILNDLKKKIGLTEVSGAGVNIYLDDNPKLNRDLEKVDSESLIHASDLRDLVNLLRTTKPQAIAINKQRVINTTAISAVGSSILINNSRLVPPFQVTVVGDAALIEQTIKISPLTKAFLERKKKVGIVFSVEVLKELSVPLYNGNLSVKYAKLTPKQ